jgi:LPXTG-motif cell wall-anchored protein
MLLCLPTAGTAAAGSGNADHDATRVLTHRAPAVRQVLCATFDNQRLAQAFFDAHRHGSRFDLRLLDHDHDGVACEGSHTGRVTCDQFRTQAAAQAFFNANWRGSRFDLRLLDHDHDGVACEDSDGDEPVGTTPPDGDDGTGGGTGPGEAPTSGGQAAEQLPFTGPGAGSAVIMIVGLLLLVSGIVLVARMRHRPTH